jgi:hypothetical protein
MFMTYFHTKYQIPKSTNLLFITIKLKAKENCCLDVMLLFYVKRKLPNQLQHIFQISVNSGHYVASKIGMSLTTGKHGAYVECY